MRSGFACLAIGSLLLWPVAAAANWQYTRWGMTETELAALSENIVPATLSEQNGHSNPYIGAAKLKAGYVAGDTRFTAFFLFRDQKLVGVTLWPDDPAAWPTANNRLVSIYGKPIVDEKKTDRACTTILRKWRAEADQNMVRFDAFTCISPQTGQVVGKSYSIRYEPLLTSEGTGL
jgi:hypothetical protein